MTNNSNLNKKIENIKYVCHFTGIDSLVKILSSDSVRFGKLKNTNDITEYAYNNTDSECHEPVYGEYATKFEILIEGSLKYDLESQSRNFFSVSVLRGLDIEFLKLEVLLSFLPMWVHYAQKNCTHGACIIFNFSKLNDLFAKMNIELSPYSDFIEYISIQNQTKPRNPLFAKDMCWSYEKEYRYFLKNTNNFNDVFLKNISQCIEAVVIGFGDTRNPFVAHYLEGYLFQLTNKRSIKLFRSSFDKSLQGNFGLSGGMNCDLLLQ